MQWSIVKSQILKEFDTRMVADDVINTFISTLDKLVNKMTKYLFNQEFYKRIFLNVANLFILD